MECAWDAYRRLLSGWIRSEVDKQDVGVLQETRLRIGKPPELVTHNGSVFLKGCTTQEDISYSINAASQYSPWSATTSANGYITAPGGHRVGICGDTVLKNGEMTGFSAARYLCIRVARDFPSIAEKAADLQGSVLLIGPPCSGKTTFLRDMIRYMSQRKNGSVAVVDERGELFPSVECGHCFNIGNRTDVITGCSKSHGINTVLKTMSPAIIAVDEITSRDDCEALMDVRSCGVNVLATAHAGCVEDLYRRAVYKPLMEEEIFNYIIVFKRDRSWKIERMHKCTGN